MSFFKPCCFALLFAVMLAPACSTTPQPAIESPVASAAACDGAVFQKKCVHKGDTVTFGKYPQATETPEPIEWIVLEIAPDANNIMSGKMLLLSKYVLDTQRFTFAFRGEIIIWESSSLRQWLNNDFLHSAFHQSERPWILLSHLDISTYYIPKGDIATDDYIFVLSLDDVSSSPDLEGKFVNEREAKATSYAIKKGVYTETNQDTCENAQCLASWWVRSGGYGLSAFFVSFNGGIDNINPINNKIGVRPAMWVKY